MLRVANESMEITWDAGARLAVVRYARGSNLTGRDGVVMVEALKDWIGPDPKLFGVLADAGGLGGTDAEYRTTAGDFFRQHRDVACIALFNMGPAIRILTEMFRLGTGVQLKAFADEPAARAWLRTRGLAL
jgi:hypothetical protein